MVSAQVPYSKAQKAVTILVALGNPRAAQLLKYFKNDEKRILMFAAKSLNMIAQPDLDKLVNEFEADFSRGAGLLDSSETMDEILTEAFTPEEVEALANPPVIVEAEPISTNVWDKLENEEIEKIVSFIQSENHQVGAFILTKLSSAKSASVISGLDRSTRASVLTRMLSMGAVRPEMAKIVENHLGEVFGKENKNDAGAGNSRIASILNQLDKTTTDEVLADLGSAVEPSRVTAVKSMLFRFEDIIQLESAACVIVFDQVPANILTLALRDAEPAIVEVALGSIGQRTRRMIENDLKTPAANKPSEITDARRQIVAAILRLSGEGRIALPSADLAA